MNLRNSNTRRVLVALMLAVVAGCDANPTDPLEGLSETPIAPAGSRSAGSEDTGTIAGIVRDSSTAAGISSPTTSAMVAPKSDSAPNAAVHFMDTFESTGAGTNSNGFRWANAGPNVTISSEQAYSGRSSLRFRFGPDAYGEHSRAELRFVIASSAAAAPREVWIEYMVRVPDNFVHRKSRGRDNNQLASFWAEDFDGSENETRVALEFDRGQRQSSFLRIASAKAKGHEHRNPDAVQLAAGTLFDESMRGKWVRIRIHLKSAPNESVVDVWRDHTLVARLPANYSIANPAWSRDYIRNGSLFGLSNSGFEEQTDFYIDDFKVYTSNPGW